MKACQLSLFLLVCLSPLRAEDGWPLSPDQESYILQPEYQPDGAPRRQAGTSGYHPDLWAVTPCAGYWGNGPGDRAWLDAHSKLVQRVQANRGPLDILLLGDSITQQWGGGFDDKPFNDAWKSRFAGKKTINLGIAGDKTQNVLWRLEHGAVDGLEPKTVILLIGVNNLYFSGEVKREDMARGIQAVVRKLREKLPAAQVLLVNGLPAGEKPDAPFRIQTTELAAATAKLRLDSDPKVQVLDIAAKFLTPDGTFPRELTPDSLHLTGQGYEIFARELHYALFGE